MRKLLIYLPFIVMALAACERESEKSTKELLEFRNKFWNSPEMMADHAQAQQLDKMYKQHITEHPDDTLTPVLMYEDAKLHLNVLNNPDQAALMLEQVYTAHPGHRLAPVALFTQAFTYENQLLDLERARAGYEKLIAEYPEHAYAKQAEILLKYLGQDPAEILENETDSFRNPENAL